MLNRMLCPMFTQIGPLAHPGAPIPETTHYFLTLTAAVWPGASWPDFICNTMDKHTLCRFSSSSVSDCMNAFF